VDAYRDFVLPLMVILRPIHIIAGMLWFGYGTLSVWILFPAAAKLGAKGDSLLRLFYGHSMYGTLIAVTAVITSLAGLIMWPVRIRGVDHPEFSGTGDIVFAIGALFGVLAWLHGGAATGKFTGQFASLGKALEENPNPSAEQLSAYEEAKRKLMTHANISAWITLVAVLGMAFARYLP
jgi:hypothetical protein